MSGTIPAQISEFTLLEALYFSENKLSGTLPQMLPASLHYIYVDGNFISGSIPQPYCSLPTVVDVALGSNPLTGALPDCIGELGVSVSALSIDNTHIYGTLPESLEKLVNIQKLTLSDNSISGTIPDVFHNMRMVTEVYLGANKLSGTLPLSLREAPLTSKLQNLHAATSLISGTFPRFVGADITLIDFEETSMSGTIGAEVAAYTNLQKLFVAGTKISGTIPDELGERCLAFTDLDLSYTDISGTVPGSFGRLRNLTDLMIAGMKITGISNGFCDIVTNFVAAGTFCILEPNVMWTDGSNCPPCLDVDTLPISMCAPPSNVYCTQDAALTPYPTAFATPEPTPEATSEPREPTTPESWTELNATLIGFVGIQLLLVGGCFGGSIMYCLFAKKQRVWPFHRRRVKPTGFSTDAGLLLANADASLLLNSDYFNAARSTSQSFELLGSGEWTGRSVLRPDVDGRFDLSGPHSMSETSDFVPASITGGSVTSTGDWKPRRSGASKDVVVDITSVEDDDVPDYMSETSDFVPASITGGRSVDSAGDWNFRQTSREGSVGDDELSIELSMESVSWGGSIADRSMSMQPPGGSYDGAYTTVSADKRGQPRYTTTLDSTALSIVAAQSRLDRDVAIQHSAMLAPATRDLSPSLGPGEGVGARTAAVESDGTEWKTATPSSRGGGSPGGSRGEI